MVDELMVLAYGAVDLLLQLYLSIDTAVQLKDSLLMLCDITVVEKG